MDDSTPVSGMEQHAAGALAALTLEEKVRLLTGRDLWSTQAIDGIGLRPMVLSDGPSGVRGRAWDERDPSLNLPSATALSSTWDPDIARRYGAAAAVEARRKGVDVILGPTINLHRTPLAGRHFECFSEDPVLTAGLAAAYVRGVQGNGVGATLKHYVANDAETDRFTVNNVVSGRALHELYLLAFEQAVVEARAWLVMSAYNAVNGVTMTEHPLLESPLNDEWGFDGVVVSDWTAVRSLDSAAAAQDLVMPGPDGPWGDALLEAVRTEKIPQAVVDRKVARILTLAARVGALDGYPPVAPSWVEDGVALAREAAAEGTVLLVNHGELPWDAAALRSVAVIGHNAVQARTQGGGSATVIPAHVVSPLDGLRAALPGIEVSHALGALVHHGLADLPPRELTNPATGAPGLRARFLDEDGQELLAEDRLVSSLTYFGGDAPVAAAAAFELTTRWTPTGSGAVRIGVALLGPATLHVDGQPLLECLLLPEDGADLVAAFLAPPKASAEIETTAGVPVDLRFTYSLRGRQGIAATVFRFQLGTEPVPVDEDDLIAAAARAAADADVALVVVGTNATVESEGFDRTTLALPGRQDDLVRAVAAANSRTVVVVNAGAPVLLPWRDQVAAVLVSYFGGQETGHALADVLLGHAEPGGRLPTTWPATMDDAPILNTAPTDDELHYDEDIHVGYRAWLRRPAAAAPVRPAFWFGSGLGYTDITVTSVDAPTTAIPGGVIPVRVGVRNNGRRAGKQVIQIYAERADSTVERPARWLVGFAPVRLPAGGTGLATIDVPTRLLAHWSAGWQYEPGAFTLRTGTCAVDLPHSTQVTLQPS
ncbi:beta-glucosidase [Frankia sp. AiPs1]|uniref:beta-glucosidase family protein n=1 Tax=Frankia sp. AiPa1 TaxID=573492 RepID=UPI00202B97D2|nr:glycoside hydrolase family 3 C-terminal domain-containing protein [Frankia sp. AiPa1]MCL9759968.1 glycoside hydrolase family 3 C-terminal domain-containing protein [Frankia sp. AiPa1]